MSSSLDVVRDGCRMFVSRESWKAAAALVLLPGDWSMLAVQLQQVPKGVHADGLRGDPQ